MKKYINIGSLADNNYSQHLGVTLYSLLRNCSDTSRIRLFIIDGGYSKENKNRLDSVCAEFGVKINYIKPDMNMLKGLKIQDKFTIATYYKYCLIESVKTDKFLYLDSDLVIEKDISKLYEKKFNKNLAFAVEDTDITLKDKENIGHSDKDRYFNAGVILIDMKNWKRKKITQKAIEFIRENPKKISFADQDGLNYALKGKWQTIDSSWNSLAKKFYFSKKLNYKNLIIHYGGFHKPWNFVDVVPYKSRYQYYVRQTPWKNTNYLDKSFVGNLKRLKKWFALEKWSAFGRKITEIFDKK
jgi:lipopolysaccharide biosynthesis glycosyltransferase